MLTKVIVSGLLLVAALTAHAAPVVYELDGYVSTKKEGADAGAQFGVLAMIGESFGGTMIYDAERELFDSQSGQSYPAPIIELTLNGSAGTDITLGGNNTSRMEASREGGIEHVSIKNSGVIDLDGVAVAGEAILRWSSLQTGQLPSDLNALRGIDPAELQPRSWTLHITSRGNCVSECDPYLVSEVKVHVTRISRRGAPEPGNYSANFATTPAGWTNQGGAWVAENGIYRNTANVAFTSSIYTGQQLGTTYTFGGSLVSLWSASGNTAGLLLHWRDAANFDEIRFSPTGRLAYNQVRNGTRRTLQTATHSIPAQTLVDIYVQRSGATASVRVMGEDAFTVNLGTQTGGYGGVFASWNRVQVHTFSFSQAPSRWWNLDRYSSGPFSPGGAEQVFTNDWTAITGQWQDTGNAGYYYATSNLPAAISTYDRTITGNYTFDVSAYLEWSNSGNLGGVLYDYRDSSNYRAVFISTGRHANGVSTRGRMEIREVRNGVTVSILRLDGPYSLPKAYTPIGVRRIGELTEVTAFGVRTVLKQPIVTGPKRVGLVTSYNKVRFDEALIGVAP